MCNELVPLEEAMVKCMVDHVAAQCRRGQRSPLLHSRGPWSSSGGTRLCECPVSQGQISRGKIQQKTPVYPPPPYRYTSAVQWMTDDGHAEPIMLHWCQTALFHLSRLCQNIWDIEHNERCFNKCTYVLNKTCLLVWIKVHMSWIKKNPTKFKFR